MTKDEDRNDIVMMVAELMSIEIEEDDISISHRLPISRKYKGNNVEPAIIVKFVQRDVKESFYEARSALKQYSTKNLGYRSDNHIYINESPTGKNKDLLNTCVKAKKKLQYDYIWTSNGKIFLRKNKDSAAIQIKDHEDVKKLQV